jgi:hypothetical protein
MKISAKAVIDRLGPACTLAGNAIRAASGNLNAILSTPMTLSKWKKNESINVFCMLVVGHA